MTIASTVSTASYLRFVDQLPSPPSVLLEVLRLCRRDAVEVRDLVCLISKDPALCARILRIGNSALYGGRGTITTIEDAVLRLGIKGVMVTALSFSLTVAIPTNAMFGGYDVAAFWRRASIESAAARMFAQRVGHVSDSEAFVCAMLMDIGIPLFAKAMPGEYGAVVQRMRAGHAEVMEEEAAVDGNHADLSGFLLREWKLPETLSEAVCAHHDPDGLGLLAQPATRELARILNLAHLSAGVMLSDDRALRLHTLEERVARWFGKPESFVYDVLKNLDRTIKEFGEAVRLDVSDVNAAQLIEQARAELINLSLSATSALSRAESKVAELQDKVTTDALTGLCNRAFFDAALAAEWGRRRQSPGAMPLGLLMVDIDHFKRFNDTYGHTVGDEVLRHVGRALRAAVRDADLVCRYGGEEFAIICPGTADQTLRQVAERVRAAIEAIRVPTKAGEERVTVSIGTSVFAASPDEGSHGELIGRADSALYEAKRAGRNRVVASPSL